MNEQLQKNSLYTAEITGYSSNGAGVARINGMVVFVQSAVRGDLCALRIVKAGKNTAYARIETIERPAQDRIENDCPAFPRCGGCDFRHISYEAELEFKKDKVQTALRRIGGVELEPDEVIGAPRLGSYRNKAQFPVGEDQSVIVTGFYRSRSHEIVPVEHCAIQSAQANALTGAVRCYMDENGVPPYDEISRTGLVRNIYVRTNSAGQALLCVVADDTLPRVQDLVEKAAEACENLAGVVLNINRTTGNAVLGQEYVTLYRDGFLIDEMDGLRFRISPASFYQINPPQAEKLYARAVEYADLTGNETVLDLYCGAGTLTLFMARRAKRAVGAEIVPEAVRDAEDNAVRNGITNVEFLCADAAEAAAQLAERGLCPEVVTVDPPRKGLDPSLIDTIAAIGPLRVVYVSCDPATLARDVKLFAGHGYSATRMTIMDMFPRTSHVECVVLMSRVEN